VGSFIGGKGGSGFAGGHHIFYDATTAKSAESKGTNTLAGDPAPVAPPPPTLRSCSRLLYCVALDEPAVESCKLSDVNSRLFLLLSNLK